MKAAPLTTSTSTPSQDAQSEQVQRPAKQPRLAETLDAIRADSRDGSTKYLEDSVAHFGGE